MENASKALLIAGTILIAILLIAMGVKLFNSTKGTTESVETTMNSTEVATFNSKFIQYLGTNKTKSDVITLVKEIIASNESSDIRITVNVNNSTLVNSTNIMNKAIQLSSTSKYTITAAYNNDGYVGYIEIKKD